MKLYPLSSLCLLGGVLLTGAATRASADEWNKKTIVTTTQSIEVPGAVLPPGQYVFKLMDSASDRHIVQIMNADENHVFATILAIPRQRMEPADKTTLTFYEAPGGGAEPVRLWFYPGDTIGQEFAYPKKRATEIAVATRREVPMTNEKGELDGMATAPTETTATEPTTQPETVAPPAEPTGSADRVVEVPSPAPAAEPAPEQPAAQPAPAAADTPSATEPAMPKTAGDAATMGLLGLALLGIATSLRIATRRARSES